MEILQMLLLRMEQLS